MLLPAEKVDRHVMSDAEEPGANGAALVEAVPVAEDPEEDLVGEILRVTWGDAKPAEGGPDILDMFLIERAYPL